jgi:DNA-directed RNA polymerase specialized sigma24 family protein
VSTISRCRTGWIGPVAGTRAVSAILERALVVRGVVLTGLPSQLRGRIRRLADQLPAVLKREARPASARQPQQQRRLNRDHVTELVRQYLAGRAMHELAELYGMHRTTVAAHLRREQVPLRRTGLSAESMNAVIARYGQGWSCQRLAERYGCDAETVRQALKREGIVLRRPWERL